MLSFIKETIMKFTFFTAVSVAALVAITPVQAATDITYKGSDSVAGFNIDYTIETNGNIGDLTVADIVSSSITLVGSAASSPMNATRSGTNTLYFNNTNDGGTSPVTASATNLLFNFAGGGGLNFCDNSGTLCYAYASAFANDTDSVVYHEGTPLPVREVDNLNVSYNLEPGTYTSVSASTQVFAAAVPEPATWAMLIAGFSMVGLVLRRRVRSTVAA
jgi:hypothetical protein